VLPAEMRRLILDYFVVTKTLAMVSKPNFLGRQP
jgi:hypothetical protein